MIIESILGLVVIGVVVYLARKIVKSEQPALDLNQDGKTDIKDAAVAVEKVKTKVVDIVDVNNDGKVTKEDAEVVVENVKKKVEEKVRKTKPTGVQASPEPVAKPKRARDKGKFKPDDKATPATNEAWVGGKAPEKKPKVAKPKKPKMTVLKK